MGKHQPPYPPEYRKRILELVRSGRKVSELSKEFGVTDQTIRNWMKQLDLDEGIRTDGVTTEEKAEIAKLRKQVKNLQEEKEILKKAAAWFARESGSIPPKDSSS